MHRRQFLYRAGFSTLLAHPFARALGLQADPAAKAALFLDQVGYRRGGSKQATATFSSAAPTEFKVRAVPSGAVVYGAAFSAPRTDAASGDQACIADFSALQTPGEYRVLAGDLVSDSFLIGDTVYAPALRLAMRSYYGQRCGCAVDLGGGYKHPACHEAGAFHASSGRSGTLANHGGWHDAGDYGRYVVNSGITTGTLLWAWEMYPSALRALTLGIPESGGKTPDYLAEVRWNLEWLLQMQDADGGVWHKQTSEHFCAFIMPEQDTLPSYVIGNGAVPYKSTAATADLAAVMAIAARCYKPYDAAFAAKCLAAARAAWRWSVAHPAITFTNPAGVSTGGYGDAHCSDELAWASAELWRTTGDAPYEKAFLAVLPVPQPLVLGAPGWSNVLPMACWSYVMAERAGQSEIRERIRHATTTAAAGLVERAGASGYGNTLAAGDYGWGSNSVAANHSLLLLVAHHLSPDQRTHDTALANLHYLLGRNCFGVSWVTGLGARPFAHPHHRPSAADGIEAPWPGLLSGGPNAHGGDAVADALPRQSPMRMWVDDQRAYSLNEVAINWNAPLVFLLAAANT